jgi:hypothetical protein
MADVPYSDENADASAGRECGNGVVLRHPDGWETQYCHMRQGSISVTRGQKVKSGEVLGKVGMSGRAAFPHVHLSVRHNGTVIDPFDPDGNIICGEAEGDPLWSNTIPYRAGGIVDIGTSGSVPEFQAIRANTVLPVEAKSGAMVIYAFLFGTRKGDVIRLALTGPEGAIIKRDTTLDRKQAQSFRAIGKKRRGPRWPAGSYEGTATLLRGDTTIDTRTLTLTLP